ncbi:hypothetical protein QTQ03_06825 [Micromonospora sp. WMMA1363]|uniref:hypothetical protein n=1 Tax=Micromonospora sp. WMMA1363 TaxID=3053985 RepID=UPI00259C74E0|nr:hypothetical protein [Micromonospora sp. WMMA1363]MDM4719324.1 hypothetical protein [Micromonospora sp. WMMA1363]
MRHRLAAPVALVAAVVAFVATLAITDSLLWSPLLAAGTALGLYLMLDDRTAARVDRDSYADEARVRVEEALGVIRGIERLSGEVRRAEARRALEDACRYVPELFERVRERSPDNLYSTAAQVGGHLRSLDGAVRQYLDIQRQPVLYHDPERLRSDGEAAFRRFADFALDSVRLVNQGEIARYAANLDTVAPPSLPDLGR